MTRVEAGAQGEHKLARGYRPVMTASAHDIADPSLRRAIADYLDHERAYVAEVADELQSATPFKHGAEEDWRCERIRPARVDYSRFFRNPRRPDKKIENGQ